MFGQYSRDYAGKRSKGDLVGIAQRQGFRFDPKEARKVENNTLEFTDGGRHVVLFHEAPILETLGDEVTVYLGGWNSLTTRERLHHRLLDYGMRCGASDGYCWIGTKAGSFPLDPELPATFSVTTGKLVKGTLADLSQGKALKALIRDFIKKAKKGDFADPAGDPWLFSPEPPAKETLLDWLQAGYVTKAAVNAALAWAGHRMGWAAYWDREGVPDYAINALRRWLKRGLALG